MKPKIISGTYKGRVLMTPQSRKTHPMSEKMRGALFNILGNIKDLSVLDAYAGTGAISLEALSRGAKCVIAVDSDIRAYRCINYNARQLSANITVTRANISSWLDHNPSLRFDIVVADPPYNHLQPLHLQKLLQSVRTGGVLVISCPSSYQPPLSSNAQEIKRKSYGTSSLVFYRKMV